MIKIFRLKIEPLATYVGEPEMLLYQILDGYSTFLFLANLDCVFLKRQV